MRMYTFAEAAKAVGVSYDSVSKTVRRKKIAVKKDGFKNVIAESDLDKLRPNRNLKYYKVSVFDDKICRYVVKKCSLRKGEAVKLASALKAAGFIARYSEH